MPAAEEGEGALVPRGEVVLRRVKGENVIRGDDGAERLRRRACAVGAERRISVHVERLADEAAIRAEVGERMVGFARATAGELWDAGFETRLEPEGGDGSHAHVRVRPGGPLAAGDGREAMGRDKLERLLARIFSPPPPIG